MRNKISGILWGLLFIAAGVGFIGNVMNWWDFTLFFDGWWTLIIIIPCCISIFQHGFHFLSSVFLTLGVLLLLAEQDLIANDMVRKLILPIILIAIGISIIFKNFFNSTFQHAKKLSAGKAMPDYTAVFGSYQDRFSGRPFMGGNITAVFGGVELDLRGAEISDDIALDCTSIFGGITLHVDEHVKIKTSCTPIFGGLSNHAKGSSLPNSPTVYINSLCMFGGVDIQ